MKDGVGRSGKPAARLPSTRSPVPEPCGGGRVDGAERPKSNPQGEYDMILKPKASLLGASALALMLALAGPVPAQEQEAEVPQAATAEISPDQLDAFVDAALDVQRLQQDLSAELQSTDSPEQAERLQQEAQDEAVQAVEGHGLSVEEYDSILRAATADPDLYATIIAMMQERNQ
jgi:hypothetical protein